MRCDAKCQFVRPGARATMMVRLASPPNIWHLYPTPPSLQYG